MLLLILIEIYAQPINHRAELNVSAKLSRGAHEKARRKSEQSWKMRLWGAPSEEKCPLIQIKSLAPNKEALLAYKCFCLVTNALACLKMLFAGLQM